MGDHGWSVSTEVVRQSWRQSVLARSMLAWSLVWSLVQTPRLSHLVTGIIITRLTCSSPALHGTPLSLSLSLSWRKLVPQCGQLGPPLCEEISQEILGGTEVKQLSSVENQRTIVRSYFHLRSDQNLLATTGPGVGRPVWSVEIERGRDTRNRSGYDRREHYLQTSQV